MYVSYEVMIAVLFIITIAIVKAHRMGIEEGNDDYYDDGYEACMKDHNYSPELQREFEDFLFDKGYVIDKSLTDVKTLKPVNKQNI